jgi:outer membrane protein with beta-barrel domain
MSERKNIDRLFQEKFKDFEAEPGEHVWKNIEAALKEKKKDRKVIPFWWRLSGVAAALLIGLLIANYAFFGDNTNNVDQVVTNEKNPAKNTTPSTTEGVAGQENKNNDVVKPAHSVNSPDNQVPNENNSVKSKSGTVPENGQAVAGTQSAAQQKTKKSAPKTIINQKTESAVAETESSTAQQKTKKYRPKTTAISHKAGSAVAVGTKSSDPKKGKNVKTDTTVPSQQGVASADKNDLRHSKNQTTDNPKNSITNTTAPQDKNGVADADNNQKTNVKSGQEKSPANNNTIQDTRNNNASGSAIADNKSKTTSLPLADKKLDSAAIATVETNELEKLLAEQNGKEKTVEVESKLNRWQVSSSVAPIYFSSTSGGSPLDEQFAANDKSYDNNLSFGVGINYALNDKLSVRTGVNKLTLGYNTNGVIFYAGLDGQSISNVSQQGNAAFIEVMNKESLNGLLPFETNLQDLNYGSISQRMGYIEVPMEMSYKLVNKQFGVTLIGGVSTLFLNENEIRVTSNTMNTDLGKANNLNNVHFSSNIGVGFKYNFWKAFEFNFEPMFKYQLQTFSKDSGNFKPYFIGLYSGVSFKF